MSAAQLTLAPPAPALPLDPLELVDVSAGDRGRLYNALDLDSWQRACTEEARRLVLAGSYPAREPSG